MTLLFRSLFKTVSRNKYLIIPLFGLLIQSASAQDPVFAPAPAEQAPATFFTALTDLLPVIVLCYGIFYFMVIKPQESSAKKQKSLLEALKKGDEVVTSGGLYGRILSTEQDIVTLELAPNVKVKVEQSHIKRRLADEKKAA